MELSIETSYFSQLQNGNLSTWGDYFRNAVLLKVVAKDNFIKFSSAKEQKCREVTEKYTQKKAMIDEFKKPYQFGHIIQKLSKVTNEGKNIDQKVFWLYKNIFLVKRYFTFGTQKPALNTIHMFQMGCTSMDIFLSYNCNLILNHIPLAEELKFVKVTLEPFKSYYIPSKLIYILVARRICFFEWSVIPEENVSSFEVINIIDEFEKKINETFSDVNTLINMEKDEFLPSCMYLQS